MRPLFYRLDKNHIPVPVSGAAEMQSERVAYTKLPGVEVSTMFLALDHAHGGPVPVLFETMIFGGLLNQEQWRYHTWEEAVEGHRRAVRSAFWAPVTVPYNWVRTALKGTKNG